MNGGATVAVLTWDGGGAAAMDAAMALGSSLLLCCCPNNFSSSQTKVQIAEMVSGFTGWISQNGGAAQSEGLAAVAGL
ncbi:hypothetical protein M0R45_030415 [Rubus argutus]|jgi:hypothetical protein|uniref:Uncharacterized protein n=1 Tax=Rubus argutus TaxID=59490 RepID=A0AAW1WB07_RUBAR